MKFDNNSNSNSTTSTRNSNSNSNISTKINNFRRRFPPYPPSYQFDTTASTNTNTNTNTAIIKVSHDKSYIRNSTLAFIAKLKHEANVSSREIQRLDNNTILTNIIT